jgi:hypothetical protein
LLRLLCSDPAPEDSGDHGVPSIATLMLEYEYPAFLLQVVEYVSEPSRSWTRLVSEYAPTGPLIFVLESEKGHGRLLAPRAHRSRFSLRS